MSFYFSYLVIISAIDNSEILDGNTRESSGVQDGGTQPSAPVGRGGPGVQEGGTQPSAPVAAQEDCICVDDSDEEDVHQPEQIHVAQMRIGEGDKQGKDVSSRSD